MINLFRIFGVRDVVAISPKDLKPKLDINKVVLSILREKYEEKFIQEIGYIVCVISAKTSPLGVIVSRSGFLHNEVEFEFLAWLPMVKEVVEAEVADIKEFGAFLQMGPIEGLAHISQIIDDYVSYDKKGNRIVAKKTKRILTKNDLVRARITSVSYIPKSMNFRLGFTMRQPFLGKQEWIKEDIEKLQKAK